MRTRDLLFVALRDNPADDTAWLALADWLEEEGQPQRGELLRLLMTLRGGEEPGQTQVAEQRLRNLLAGGVEPCLIETVNSLHLRFALIPAGSFWMGSSPQEPGRYNDEDPLHRVTITSAFWMGVHTVTQEQYATVMGSNPSSFQPDGEEGDKVAHLDCSLLPVDSVTWEDAREFCRALSNLPAERLARRVYRLPTEAEWEYASRAGTTSPFHFGRSLTTEQANHDPNRSDEGGMYREHPMPVGSFPPNAFGLYEVHGNVWEWCSDWFDENYYQESPANDPPGAAEGDTHVLRGGSWFSHASVCRSACRNPVAMDSARGFRILLEHHR
jgi:uncharacterized protein (TIGR02996 family)